MARYLQLAKTHFMVKQCVKEQKTPFA